VKTYPNIQFLTPAQIEATHGFDTLRVHAFHTLITDTVIKQTESRCTTDSRCCWRRPEEPDRRPKAVVELVYITR
jgi:hypothetical protein